MFLDFLAISMLEEISCGVKTGSLVSQWLQATVSFKNIRITSFTGASCVLFRQIPSPSLGSSF
jgi:hypothetical protein